MGNKENSGATNLPWLASSIIFLTVAGSRAYGTATETSDLDIKGICIPPSFVRTNLFHGFEQAINYPSVNDSPAVVALRNPQNPKIESTIFAFDKFCQLASEVNPNVVELLFTERIEQLIVDDVVGRRLLDFRKNFLSSRARFTFINYGLSQLAKINRHRKWLLNPVATPPNRADFGLAPERPLVVADLDREIRKLVEEWNLHQYPLDDLARSEMKEKCWQVIAAVSGRRVDWDNWPEEYWQAAAAVWQQKLGISEEMAMIVKREHQYDIALQSHHSYMRWKEKRNAERKPLEEKYGYDTKHAMHLVRLLRMGHEILATGLVFTGRPDREELLAIRNGAWTYEQLEEYANEMDKHIATAYANTKLPRQVDKEAVNKFYHETVAIYDATRVLCT